NLSYTALLFIPAKAPYDFYNADYKSGLQLYSKGVFIMDKAKDLVPECFRFVTGLIDSDDLNLNISREILQQDRQVKALASSVEKRIQRTLEDMLKNDREAYEKLFDNFGLNIKYDIYRSFGANKEKLQDLLLYRSSKDGSYVTLKEYTERMPEDQKNIYFASGTSVEDIEKLPALEKVRDKGYEILYFLDAVDEFVISMMNDYNEKPFRSVSKGDLDLDSEEEKKEREEKAEENKDMLTMMKEAIGSRVSDVRISSRLKDDPVVLVSDEGMSIEMEKVLSQNPDNRGMMKAVKILEINPDHPVFETLKKVYETDQEKLKEYAGVLYDQACLIEGLPIDDPVDYARKITDLMVQASK
ncbi:MAG: molecular chaperone HtpG, partial [Erysipelotrichaceae bacterium]|nr:molecular chaperone HtpG [Erysipelotrichaceae bacterium]